jgi:ABC-type transport system involved in multi-copper enzyme maturation permease subunit
MGPDLLHYRPWRGRLHGPGLSVWPIARTALGMLFRRKLFWVLYALGLFIFLMFYFGQFMLDWAGTQIASTNIQIGKITSERLLLSIRRAWRFLSGSQETFRYFFAYQGTMLMVLLTLAGAVLIGNDFAFGSVPFYLAKPISRWHYILGKCLAVGIVVNLMTTVPALLLYVQYGFGNWDYFLDTDFFLRDKSGSGPAGVTLLLGILSFGLVLTVCLSIMLVATASWLRHTMPMIMVWTAVFLFLPLLSVILVDGLRYQAEWRLLDMWNNLCLAGNACLGYENRGRRNGPQPELWEVVVVLGGLCLLCLAYLGRRTRAVEVVR